MSNAFFQSAGKKLFEKHLRDYAPADPLYETYTDKRGRQRRRKRELPPGLSPRDQKILRSVKRRAHYLDKGFKVAGMRFGWTFIIGIVPGAGDVADAALNYLLVVRKARQAGIPDWLLGRMLANNAVSVIAGLVPIVGDVVLAAFKANSRNAALLEEFLRIRGEEMIKAQEARKSGAPVPAAVTGVDATGAGVVATQSGAANQAPSNPTVSQEPRTPQAASPAESSVVPGGVDKADKPQKSRTRTVSWWGNGKQKSSLKPPPPDRGRFVEDVNSNESASPSTAIEAKPLGM